MLLLHKMVATTDYIEGVNMKSKKELNIQVGMEIQKARRHAGLTQAQLGEMVGLDTKNVSDIERGVTGIKLSTLKRICEKLNISSDSLLFENRYKNTTVCFANDGEKDAVTGPFRT